MEERSYDSEDLGMIYCGPRRDYKFIPGRIKFLRDARPREEPAGQSLSIIPRPNFFPARIYPPLAVKLCVIIGEQGKLGSVFDNKSSFGLSFVHNESGNARGFCCREHDTARGHSSMCVTNGRGSDVVSKSLILNAKGWTNEIVIILLAVKKPERNFRAYCRSDAKLNLVRTRFFHSIVIRCVCANSANKISRRDFYSRL